MPGTDFKCNNDTLAVLDNIGSSLSVVKFAPDGTIVYANANFCSAMGYEFAEIDGEHHSMFVAPEEVCSHKYKDFWIRLRRGEFDAAEYKKIGKDGREVWMQACYNPIVDAEGKVQKIVEVATVITREKLRNDGHAVKIDEISLIQGVIEFSSDGTVLTANDTILDRFGRRMGGSPGTPHKTFVALIDAHSPAYIEFWQKLNSGEFVPGTFKRSDKNGKQVWVQASSNPVFEQNGEVRKIIKISIDLAAEMDIECGLPGLVDSALE